MVFKTCIPRWFHLLLFRPLFGFKWNSAENYLNYLSLILSSLLVKQTHTKCWYDYYQSWNKISSTENTCGPVCRMCWAFKIKSAWINWMSTLFNIWDQTSEKSLIVKKNGLTKQFLIKDLSWRDSITIASLSLSPRATLIVNELQL